MSREKKTPKAPALSAVGKPAKRVPAKQLQLLDSNIEERTLIIRLDQVDQDGPWSLADAGPESLRRIFKAIRSFETMKVREAFKGYPGKDYSAQNLPNKAVIERLEYLGLDDQDTISCLRLSGTGRLFGFRREHYFHVLWWDPHHEVWPSEKKRT